MPPLSPIPVVCALIEDEAGRVLIAQRPPHKHLGLKWEFPGGKLESAESAEAALVREIKEELGCDILLLRSLPRSRYDYGTVVIDMLPFVCRLATGSATPSAHEHVDVRWIWPEELDRVDLAPADVPVVAHYRAELTARKTPLHR